MKIAIDCRMYNSSGIGTYLQGILPYLLAEQKNNYLLLGNFNILSKYKAKNVEILLPLCKNQLLRRIFNP